MTKLVIRCHPCTPVAPAELHDWLEQQLDKLRAAAPEAIIQLSRLTQEAPDHEIAMGWLIELELPADSSIVGDEGITGALADALTDMRFLGLQPAVLQQNDLPTDPQGGRSQGRPVRAEVSGPVLTYPGLK